jgi:hypothetical protein
MKIPRMSSFGFRARERQEAVQCAAVSRPALTPDERTIPLALPPEWPCGADSAARAAWESSGDGWQRAQQARRRMSLRNASVAVEPLPHRGGQYYRRGEPEFDALVRQVTRANSSLPSGMVADEFARRTYAIARDGASAKDNLGVVYLNDPAKPGDSRRVAYGLHHIWAPGSGGGHDAGHRDEWRRLPGLAVDSPKMLAWVIMAALTDVNAEYPQTRMPNGNIEREYRRFAYRHGGNRYVLGAIRVVLRRNGMVITAYPRKGAEAKWIGRETSANRLGAQEIPIDGG